MKIFISWSKDTSRQYAVFLRDWLELMFQEVKPFVSDQDISLGKRGLEEIEKRLDGYDFGILLLTKENLTAPWINYEAGALSRAVVMPESRVIPLLIDIDISDLASSPLSSFQGQAVSKEGIKRLCTSINESLQSPLSESSLAETFELWWPKLETNWSSVVISEQKSPAVSIESISHDIRQLTKVILQMRNSENTQTGLLRMLQSYQEQFHAGNKPINHLNALALYEQQAEAGDQSTLGEILAQPSNLLSLDQSKMKSLYSSDSEKNSSNDDEEK